MTATRESEVKQLTVKELIAKLELFPPDMPVSVEGCDCFGAAGNVIIWQKAVVVIRTDGDFLDGDK